MPVAERGSMNGIFIPERTVIHIREDAIFQNNLFRHSYLSYNTGCGSLFFFVGPVEIGSSLPCEEGCNRLRKKPYNENRLTNREQNQ